MDTSAVEIDFDSDGICNYCKWYAERVNNEIVGDTDRNPRLAALIDRIKKAGRGKEYDCLVGVSGGIDSSTVLVRAKEYGLRPLAVHFDNGWNSEAAVVNIKHLLDQLDVDLVTYVVDWEEFRDLQLAFIRSGVPNCEIPTDHGLSATIWKTAREYGIKYILSGTNVVTEGFMPRSWSYDAMDLRHLAAIHKLYGTRPLKSFPRLGALRWLTYVIAYGHRIINLLNYIDYNKAEERKRLTDIYGWRDYGGKHYESVFTRFYQGHYLPSRFGFDKRRAHLSCLVLAGQLTRDQAIESLLCDNYSPELMRQDLRFVLKKFRLSRNEWQELMNLPRKKHKDFPNNEYWFYHALWIRKLFKKVAMWVG